MKKILLITTFISCLILNAQDAEKTQDLILNIEQQHNYDENLKYEKSQELKKIEDEKKSNLNIDIDVDINKEQKTIEKLKLDIGTKF